jgi:outer membrane murein-binding lipoprotein Lpp
MRKSVFLVIAVIVISWLVISGCSQTQKASSSGEAISIADTMKTVEEKASYLVQQAQAFYNSKDFQQAIDVSQYILNKLDKNSQEAKSLLEKAKEQLQAAAKSMADDVSKKLNVTGK